MNITIAQPHSENWIKVADFFVPGLPRPGGSKRGFYIASLKRVVITDANKKVKTWKDTVSAFAADQFHGVPLDGALRVDVLFTMPRPKGHWGSGKKSTLLRSSAPHFHTSKPDVLKLMRSTEDALTGIIWRDDSANVDLRLRKIYGERAGAQITVYRIAESTHEPAIAAELFQ